MGGSSSVQHQDGNTTKAPSEIKMGKVTQTEVELLWEDVYNKFKAQRSPSPEEGYTINVHLQRRTKTFDWQDLCTDAVVTYTDVHLDPGETYIYRVKFKGDQVSGGWSKHLEVSSVYRSESALHKALEVKDASEIQQVLKRFPLAELDVNNLKQYQEQLQRMRTPVQPISITDVQGVVREVNMTCAVAALNKALDVNAMSVTPATIMATQERPCGIQDQLIDEYRTVLKEVKQVRGKKHKSQRKPDHDGVTYLQPIDIANVITCVNGFKIYLKLDKALERNSKEDTIFYLRQLPLHDFEEANTDDYHACLLKERDKPGEKMNIGTDIKEILFLKRLDQIDVQRCINIANFECAIRAIVVSVEKNDEEKTDEALRNRHAGILNLRRNTRHGYFEVIRNINLGKMKTSDSKSLRDKIQKAVDDYNWLLSINEAIMQKNRKSVINALDEGKRVSKFIREEPDYAVVLLWNAQNKKKQARQHSQEDAIYKDILTKQEIQEVVNYHPLLLDINRNIPAVEEDGLNKIFKDNHETLQLKRLILNPPDDEKRCYLTLLKEAKNGKKSNKVRWCWSSGTSDEYLTLCEVQYLVEEFWRVKILNETLDKQDTKDTWEALQSLKSFSDSDEWGKIDRSHSAEYYTLLKEERSEKKQKKTKNDSNTGFEKMLTKKEIQNIIKVHPWIASINTFLEKQVHMVDGQSLEKKQNGHVGPGAAPEPSSFKAEESVDSLHKLMTMLRTPDCSRYWRINKKGIRDKGYLVLLLKAFREKLGQSAVSRQITDSAYRRWLTKNELQNVIEDYTWLLDINDAIEERNAGDIMGFLEGRRAHFERPDPTKTDELGYSFLLLEALDKKRVRTKTAGEDGSSQDGQEDIYKDILKRQEIQDVIRFHRVLMDLNTAVEEEKKDSLATVLEKRELQLREYVVQSTPPEDMCYQTLMVNAKEKKKKMVLKIKGPYEKILTHSEVEKIVQVHKIVLAVNEACTEQTAWEGLEERHPRFRELCRIEKKEKEKEEKWRDEYLRILLNDERNIKIENWKSMTDEEKNKKVRHGFEQLLTLQEIRDIVTVFPRLVKINEKVEEFLQETEGKQAVYRFKETEYLRKHAGDLYSMIEEARQTGNWSRSTLSEKRSKGYLKLFSVRLAKKKEQKQISSTANRQRQLTISYLSKKEIQKVLADWEEYDDIADFLISKRHSDEECVERFEELLKTSSHETVANYRYRMEDDAGKKKSKEGDDQEELWGHSHLHLAICFRKLKTAVLLAESVPALIDQDIGTYPDNKKKYLGLTPFHIAVGHGLGKLVEIMLKTCKDKQLERLFIVQDDGRKTRDEENNAVGQRMKGTVFMGQLPLQVAVLSHVNENNRDDDEIQTSNKYLKVLEILFNDKRVKDHLWKQNFLGDTVFHTIMRFIRCFPNDEPNAVSMMKYLDGKLSQQTDLLNGDTQLEQEKRKLLFLQNKNKETALQMATKFGHTELFRYMMGMKGVYQIILPHDDIYEIRRFDVTEIDKVALMEDFWKKQDKSNSSTVPNQQSTSNEDSCHEYLSEVLWNKHITKEKGNQKKDNLTDNKGSHPFTNTREQSVSELLCCQALSIAISMVQADVFETILRRKWLKYKFIFYPFLIVHVLLLVLMSVYATAKASAIENRAWAPPGFLVACNVFSLAFSVLYFCQEFPLRFCFAKQPLAIKAVHHNIIYRVMMVLFAVCLFFDSILNLVLPTKNNWFLLFGLVFGTWLLLFFLRVCPLFSVYIVLINEGLFKTVVPFAILISLQMFVFSVCMHTIFMHPEPQAKEKDLADFDTYGKSLLMMAKLMIGLVEMENLLSSREDVLAVIFFTVFVLLTFLLMINALIGVLTNRFQDTQLNKQQVVYLQNLSVIIFIEGWILGLKPLMKLAVRCGRKPKNEENDDKERFVLSYRKVPSSMADNPNNLEHALHKDRKKLDEIAGKVDTVLDYQTARAYDGMRVLKIYDYSRRY